MATLDPRGFADALLHSLGLKPTPTREDMIVAWEGREGGAWHNSASFNPLNTSQPESGSKPYKAGAGVQAYPDWSTGVKATAQTLTNGRYGSILDALRSQNEQAFGAALVDSPWDAGHYSGHFDVASSDSYSGPAIDDHSSSGLLGRIAGDVGHGFALPFEDAASGSGPVGAVVSKAKDAVGFVTGGWQNDVTHIALLVLGVGAGAALVVSGLVRATTGKGATANVRELKSNVQGAAKTAAVAAV